MRKTIHIRIMDETPPIFSPAPRNNLRRLKNRIASLALLYLFLAAPALAVGLSDAATGTRPFLGGGSAAARLADAAPPSREAVTLARPHRLIWEGADLDGDGAADIANPTAKAPRAHDAYGDGRFGASRDGGSRAHAGVDYMASAGQAVVAPISGFVAKIGYVYPGDLTLRYVEIDNPALKLSARVFYVAPGVRPGEAVAIGRPIGTAQTLQDKYPGGITDHVHLELADKAGQKLDAATLIVARLD